MARWLAVVPLVSVWSLASCAFLLDFDELSAGDGAGPDAAAGTGATGGSAEAGSGKRGQQRKRGQQPATMEAASAPRIARTPILAPKTAATRRHRRRAACTRR